MAVLLVPTSLAAQIQNIRLPSITQIRNDLNSRGSPRLCHLAYTRCFSSLSESVLQVLLRGIILDSGVLEDILTAFIFFIECWRDCFSSSSLTTLLWQKFIHSSLKSSDSKRDFFSSGVFLKVFYCEIDALYAQLFLMNQTIFQKIECAHCIVNEESQ